MEYLCLRVAHTCPNTTECTQFVYIALVRLRVHGCVNFVLTMIFVQQFYGPFGALMFHHLRWAYVLALRRLGACLGAVNQFGCVH